MIWLFLKMWPIAVWAGLLINEVSYKGTPEWVELYNDSSEQKDLSGLILKDANNSSKDDLSLDGAIGPNEYRIFENGKSWLNDTGDTLYLISSSSGETIDQMIIEKAEEGKTYGRVGGSFVYMNPTKGSANSSPATPSPTQTPTSTPSPTRTSTPTTPPTATQTLTVKIEKSPTPTKESTIILTAKVDEEQESSPTAEIYSPTQEVLGVSDDKKVEEVDKKTDNRFQQYGYALMIGGSAATILGGGFGYLRYRRDGDKMS